MTEKKEECLKLQNSLIKIGFFTLEKLRKKGFNFKKKGELNI